MKTQDRKASRRRRGRSIARSNGHRARRRRPGKNPISCVRVDIWRKVQLQYCAFDRGPGTLALGAAGAVLGFSIGGPQGAAIGSAVGISLGQGGR